MPPAPVGTPADIAFGGAVVALGAMALLLMGNGFGTDKEGGRRKDGIGLPGAPDARRARDKDGKPTKRPSDGKDKD